MKDKSVLCGLIFKILIKGMSGVAKYDKEIRDEVASLPDGYKVKMGIFPHSDYAKFVFKNNRVYKTKDDNCDIEILFKNLKVAKKVLLGRMSIAQAFSMHAIVLEGNINDALVLVRIMERTEDYLFPKWYTKSINRKKKNVSSFRVYLWLLFGCNKLKKERNNGK